MVRMFIALASSPRKLWLCAPAPRPWNRRPSCGCCGVYFDPATFDPSLALCEGLKPLCDNCARERYPALFRILVAHAEAHSLGIVPGGVARAHTLAPIVEAYAGEDASPRERRMIRGLLRVLRRDGDWRGRMGSLLTTKARASASAKHA